MADGGMQQEMLLHSEEAVQRFDKFFSIERQRTRIEAIASQYPQARSLEVDLQELAKHDSDLADAVVEQPDVYAASAEKSIELMEVPTPIEKAFAPHVRFYNVPDLPKYRPMVLELGSDHLNKLVSIEGVISSISEIKPRMKKAVWRCRHCEAIQPPVYTEKTEPVTPPFQCTNRNCNRNHFELLEEKSGFVDMQRAQVQDFVEKLRGNVPAVHVELWLEDDLTNKIAPGDKVTLSGALRLKPISASRGGRSSVYAKFLEVVHIREMELEFEELEISREEEQEILKLSRDPKLFDKIVASIAPSIYGYTELKQAIALQLFGGTPGKALPDGERIRSDAHILLIGDPGIGKSTMLEYVSHIAPKCIVVSGGSSTGVGITAAAEKDEIGEGWVLKAGAMVLANGGVVAVDELDKMREEDRGAMHQAMEQQFISVAKAGIVTSFQTRTAVLAAANPKLGRFDPNTPPAQQFAISPALLSRFDLIFTMRDVLDESRDRGMAEHILVGHMLASRHLVDKESPVTPPLDPIVLRKYIAYARRHVAPQLSKEAADKIRDYYVELRKIGKEQNTFPVTPRQIEGLVRLAEANAKIRLSPVVELEDAQRALNLFDFVIHEVFVDRETGRLDSDVVNIGVAKSRLDRVRTILNIITDLEKQFDLVAVEDVVREASSYNIDEYYARNLVEELQRKGDLYAPKPGYIKSARPRE